MAYPFYPTYPYGYTPQPTQPLQQNQQASGIIWVSGAQEAQMYPVAPNNAVALWEQSGKTIYLKSADATGKPTLRMYDLVERAETPQMKQDSQDSKIIDYVLKSDIEPILSAIAAMKKEIKSLKKKEVDDDDE